MDRGEVEVEEARQTRTRRASIFITDIEKDEYGQDCRVSSRSMNETSPTVLVFLKETHGVERDCQASREATEPHAVDCVRVCFDVGA